MMNMPPIRYALSKDGATLAYTDAGSGHAFVHMPYPMNHLQLQWKSEDFGRFYEALASRHRLINYDGRGQGLSDRDLEEWSPEALLGDLEAIIDKTGVDRFVLYAGFSPVLALVYAAKHPEKVSHLILWSPSQREGGSKENPLELGTVHTLLSQVSWELYTDTLAFWLGYDSGEDGDEMRRFLEEGVDPEAYNQIMKHGNAYDFAPLIGQIQCPALVIQPRQARMVDAGGARRLVAALPNAEFAMLEGMRGLPTRELLQPTLDAIDQFVGASVRGEPADPGLGSGIHTILFTDVEASTDLVDRFGDVRAREAIRRHEELTGAAISEHSGTAIKSMGDGVMASFDSTVNALDAAIQMQRAIRDEFAGSEIPIRIRIGLNAGEPIVEDDDLHGTAVIQAARVMSVADGGEIMVTNVVRELVKGRDFLFHDRGVAPLKGFDEPVRLFEVRWQDDEETAVT